jgi:hypothetical protein
MMASDKETSRMPFRFAVYAQILLFLAPGSTAAFIQRTIPLKDVIAAESWIFTARVASIDSAANTVTLKVEQELKGKVPRKQFAFLLFGDDKARQAEHKAQLLERIEPAQELVVFGSQRGTKTTLFAYTNGTWFQVVGEPHQGQSVLFSFTHFEPYLRRTFKGATEELRQIVADGLAGKIKPPPPNPKEPPGLGPPLKK